MEDSAKARLVGASRASFPTCYGSGNGSPASATDTGAQAADAARSSLREPSWLRRGALAVVCGVLVFLGSLAAASTRNGVTLQRADMGDGMAAAERLRSCLRSEAAKGAPYFLNKRHAINVVYSKKYNFMFIDNVKAGSEIWATSLVFTTLSPQVTTP